MARPWWAPVVEGTAIAAFFALLSSLLAGLVRAAGTPGRVALLLAAAPVGYLLADFLSGCVHWFCDTFLEEETPVLGPLIIAPFREHHHDPLAITRHGFFELNGNSALGLLPLLAWMWWRGMAGGEDASAAALFVEAAVLFGALAMFATNQFHCWAHQPQPPAAVRWLQRRGLILAPGQHARHHLPPHAGAYCITAGWLNGPLDRLRFFARCERALGVLRMRRALEPDGPLSRRP